VRHHFVKPIYLTLPLVLSACTIGRVDSRVAYWQKQAEIHVPAGTSLGEAKAFFVARFAVAVICMSGPDIHDAYSASEQNVGRFAFTEYSVLIVADVSANQTVDRVRVLRVGVGL